MSQNSLDECRRLLEQIECGIKFHMIVSNDSVPVEDIVKSTCEIGSYIFYPLHGSKLVSSYFDAHGFKHGLQSSIRANKKSLSKKTICYISDNHHKDIVYADLLNLIVSYPEERCIFKDKTFITKLAKMMSHLLSIDSKENSKPLKTLDTDTQLALETKALEHISDNLVIVLNITSLQSYYQWISMYPNLEKLCFTRFINDTTDEKEIIKKKQAKGTEAENEQTLDVLNFMVKYVKDFILKKLVKSNDNDDEIKNQDDKKDENELPAFPIREELFSNPKQSQRFSNKISSQLSKETVQIFKRPECFNLYPKLIDISNEFFSESRFKSFITTYNTLLTKVKANLLKMKNLNNKYKSNCQKIIETYQNKGLIHESYVMSSDARQQLANFASLNERIEMLHAEIKEKEAMIKLKEKIVKDKLQAKTVLNNEIQSNIDEKMDKLSHLLLKIEKLDKCEMQYVPKYYEQLSELEKKLVEVMINIVFLKQVSDSKFSTFTAKVVKLINDPPQLVSILRARRDSVFTESVTKKIKQFTQKYGHDKFEKGVFKLLAMFLSSLVKKFNLKVLLEARYEKLGEVNQILIQVELDISYYKGIIDDRKEELEDLLIKQRNSGDEVPRSNISEDDARNEQIYKEVVRNLKKVEGKLFKSKVRMKNLIGD